MLDILAAMKRPAEIIVFSAEKLLKLHSLNLKIPFKVKVLAQTDCRLY